MQLILAIIITTIACSPFIIDVLGRKIDRENNYAHGTGKFLLQFKIGIRLLAVLAVAYIIFGLIFGFPSN